MAHMGRMGKISPVSFKQIASHGSCNCHVLVVL